MLQTCKSGSSETFCKSLRDSPERKKWKGNDDDVFKRQRTIFSVSHFRYEFIRKATFDSWPVSYISKDDLAKAGFFYLKKDDYVQCFSCKGVVGFWEHGDRPFIEHEKHFPRCPFVQCLWTGNVPVAASDEEEKNLYILLNKFLQTSLDNCRPSIPPNGLQTDAVALGRSHGFVYPSYSSISNRMHSFGNWPKIGVPNPEELAKVGFFSTGMSDFVLCYCCGGGLFNWTEDDDPVIDHQMYYSHCPLLKSNSSEKSKQLSSASASQVLSEEEADLLLQYPLSTKLLDMGLSPGSIKGALKEFLEQHLYLPATFMNCMDVVVEWDERQKKQLKKELDLEHHQWQKRLDMSWRSIPAADVEEMK